MVRSPSTYSRDVLGNSRYAGGVVLLVVLAAVVVHGLAQQDTVVATITYLGVLVGASVGAWIGAERAPRGQRLVPRLIAVGVSLTALGDVLWAVVDVTGSGTDVSIADPPWFASYLFLCAALWVVLDRSQGRGHADLSFLVDALTIVVVSVLLFWSTSVSSILADQSVTPFVRTVWAAYPIADAVLLALVVRVLTVPSARAAVGSPFAAGVCLWLAADVAYLQAPEGRVALAAMDAAWMVAPVLLARAAWRGRDVTSRASDFPARGFPIAQLVVAVGALFVPAGIELANHLRDEPSQPLLLFTGTAALIGLAFVRTARLMISEERSRTALEEARDAAMEASRAKSMFLANMSHEIRTPLTTVLAAEEMLEDTPLDDLQTRLVQKMRRSGQLLMTLVERILDFSRLEAGQLTLSPTDFDLHAMVSDVADTYAPRLAERGLQLVTQVDPGTPRLVHGDSGRLFQVLTNLLENALKFTHEGEVRLLVRPTWAAHGGETAREVVEFVVADTGIGIAAADLESVFESFRQVDGSTTRRYAGSGLGLAICKEMIQLMGGTITLQSQVGVGTTFVVRAPLPAASASPAPAAPVVSPTPRLRAG